jgi:pectinesterase inhibitor-like protein
MAATATRQIAFILSLLAASAHVAIGTTPVINATCAAVSHNSTKHTEYAYCVGALSADPAASSATDARELAAAAVNLTVANITDTKHIISDLLMNLGRCFQYYGEMNDIVSRVLDDIRAGLVAEASKKLLGMANDDLGSMCDLILAEGYAEKDPIRLENQNVYLVSAMASDITELLLRSQALPPEVSN